MAINPDGRDSEEARANQRHDELKSVFDALAAQFAGLSDDKKATEPAKEAMRFFKLITERTVLRSDKLLRLLQKTYENLIK